MTWPLADALSRIRLAFDATVTTAEGSHVIRTTLWWEEHGAVIREGDPESPWFEMRAFERVFVELDYHRRVCVLRLGEGEGVDRRAVLAHLAGPAAAAFDATDDEWDIERVAEGTRYRPRTSYARLREIVLDNSGLPARALTDDLEVIW